MLPETTTTALAAIETFQTQQLTLPLLAGEAASYFTLVWSTYLPFFTYHFLAFLFKSVRSIIGIIFSYVQHGTIYTVTASITLDFYAILWLSFLFTFTTYLILRYRYWNMYSRLQSVSVENRDGFDLHPDVIEDNPPSYPDEFMNVFLSSIKVFGYLEQNVFHELARHLQTIRLNPGQVLFDESNPTNDFYTVVEGTVQIYVKAANADTSDEDDWEANHHLLHEVETGGTVSSLFTILDLFTQDFVLPGKLSEYTGGAEINHDEKETAGTPSLVDDDLIIPFIPESNSKSSEKVSAAQIKPGIRIQDVSASPKSESPDTPEKIKFQQSVFPRLWGRSISLSSEVPPSESEKSGDSFDSPKLPKIRSIHHLTARAKTSTSLAVLPAAAFLKLNLKFPNAAAHIAQVILTRFQRVTFSTLYKYLGLSSELLNIERKVNDLAGGGLPRHLFPQNILEEITVRHANSRLRSTSPIGTKTKKPRFVSNNPREKAPIVDDSPNKSLAFFNEEQEDQISDAVLKCIAYLIGMTPLNKEKARPNRRRPSIPPVSPYSGIERFYYSKAGGSQMTQSSHKSRKHSYLDADDLSSVTMSSRNSSIGNDTDEEDIIPDVQIKYYWEGEVLVNEGGRNDGIFFVIDGVLEVSVTSKKMFENSHGSDNPNRKSGPLFIINPGGLAGYLAAVTGNISFVTITARTDTTVGFMHKKVLDKYVESYPNILLCLSKRLVNQLPPLVFHIDIALEWGQMNAGQILCKQGDPSHSIFIVLTGRLRSISQTQDGKMELVGEYGNSESVGEMEVLMDSSRTSTIHAIRDTEVAILPKTLFNILAIQHPEIMLTIARLIAVKSQDSNIQKTSLTRGIDNVNLKTICILPLNENVPILKFSELLKESLESLGASVSALYNSTVMNHLGKHAFTKFGRLRLLSWLAEQEESHRIVLYIADGGIKTPWSQRCIRQADCLILVAIGDGDESLGENDRLLTTGMKTTARKELVLLHPTRSVTPGSTSKWLKPRPWFYVPNVRIHVHHHVQMSLGSSYSTISQRRPTTLLNLKTHFIDNYISPDKAATPIISTGIRSDFARLGRRLLSKSIGLVLGGGGARGISQVGLIRAFEEVGIPFDMIGGVSIGSFVGGLYAKHGTHVSIYGRTKLLSSRIISIWRSVIDLTYPITSLFTGHEFNRGIWKCFSDQLIEDLWLPYFAVTTNITLSRLEVHTSGYLWRYVRASMTLSGFVPPLCDKGHLLMDGGYVNNVPADIMRQMGAAKIVAVDVGIAEDTSPVNYGDSLSGWWVLLCRLDPFRPTQGRILELNDINSRIAYVSSVKQLEAVKRMEGVMYLQPPISGFAMMEFGKFKEIEELGYQYGKEIIAQWIQTGELTTVFGIKVDEQAGKDASGRRASI